ncbi:2-hydroxyacid dehydrogenase [Nakamurella flavida]|uniref:2-hydroxyacid dehydrogenase n=1 Tax=Nakamurella flavida TaxID=363630 RepID=A0A938YHT7_9ACTN|nr:2-hydroxyacid dehydrogenase [Nakamurella flavida]MBM9476182.1 2-hydroxyacid dehydrogenase [Nakamurella flavida]MDP9777073.1 phosphoglycerate dehydrogenase-like enzyme [Nakamurella flavida]
MIVCIPDPASAPLLGDLPAEVEVIAWDGYGDEPENLRHTRIWVPQVEDADELPRKFAAMPELEVILLLSAGVEDMVGHIPDGVVMCDARGVHGSSVAELVLALVLASQRRLPHFLDAQREGRWDLVEGEDMRDKRVVVVGAGDLGEQTARRLRAFDAEPVMVAHSAREGVHATDELPDLLPDADVVVLTLPLTPGSEGMVDADFLARMADGALLVNVSRGKIVDTDALLAELTSGRLRAALDVVEPEPLPAGHPLWTAPGLILTPHAAGHISQAGPRAFALVGDQIRRYVAGEELINVVEGEY